VDSSHDGRIRVGDAAHHGRRHHGYLHPSGRILDNFRVFDKDGAGITLGEFLRILNELQVCGVDGEDNKSRLQMQSLSASAVLLSGKALLKG
jgi:hypothetical protein